jgi:hypothetical protein
MIQLEIQDAPSNLLSEHSLYLQGKTLEIMVLAETID